MNTLTPNNPRSAPNASASQAPGALRPSRASEPGGAFAAALDARATRSQDSRASRAAETDARGPRGMDAPRRAADRREAADRRSAVERRETVDRRAAVERQQATERRDAADTDSVSRASNVSRESARETARESDQTIDRPSQSDRSDRDAGTLEARQTRDAQRVQDANDDPAELPPESDGARSVSGRPSPEPEGAAESSDGDDASVADPALDEASDDESAEPAGDAALQATLLGNLFPSTATAVPLKPDPSLDLGLSPVAGDDAATNATLSGLNTLASDATAKAASTPGDDSADSAARALEAAPGTPPAPKADSGSTGSQSGTGGGPSDAFSDPSSDPFATPFAGLESDPAGQSSATHKHADPSKIAAGFAPLTAEPALAASANAASVATPPSTPKADLLSTFQSLAGSTPSAASDNSATASAGQASTPSYVSDARFAQANTPTIVQSVRGQLLPNGGTLTLRLDPPEIGALQVAVVMKDGLASVSLATDNPEAARLMTHSLSQLRDALASAGVAVDRLTVQQAPKQESSTTTGDQRNSGNPQQSGDQASPWNQDQRRDQQRRDLLERMWRKASGDDVNFVA